MSTSTNWLIKPGMVKLLVEEHPKFRSNRLKDVEVHEESDADILISGTPYLGQDSICWRCNRAITDPASIARGVGPDCAAALGIPDSINASSELERVERVWIPKNQIINPPFTARGTLSRAADRGKKYKATLALGDVRKKSKTDQPDVVGVLIFDCPWISKGFNVERAQIEGYFWSHLDKVACFKYSNNTLEQLYSMCAKWKIELSLSEELQEALSNLHAIKAARNLDLAADGMNTRQSIKQMTPEDADAYEWREILNFDPWHHQAQAIRWAAHLLSVSMPSKNSEKPLKEEE